VTTTSHVLPPPATPDGGGEADAKDTSPATDGDRPAKKSGGSRLRALDGLRLLAALAVCSYHYTAKDQEVAKSWGTSPVNLFHDLSKVGTYGTLGVQLFFMISGFVICMSSWGKPLGEFFRSRVARIYPAYWVAIVMVTVASLILPVVVHHLRSDEILLNLTLLQQPMGSPRVIGVDWTLWVELKFYIFFGLLVVWRGVTYRRVVLFCILWTVACVFARVADNPFTDELVFRDHAPYFIAGLAFYLIHRYGSDWMLWGIVVMSFLLAQRYSVTAMWHPGQSGPYARNPHVVELLVALLFVIMAAVALGWLSWANWKWLTFAGALTYPFYLIHEHLGWFGIRIYHRYLGLGAYPTLFATVLTMLVLAYLMNKFVEKPFGPRLKRALKISEERKALVRGGA
jgi:peptidoglycan/LPS O-acetylase OafA/YrhL